MITYFPRRTSIESTALVVRSYFRFARTLAQRRLCAAPILALLFADIVRFAVATLALPLTFAQRAL
jgi:hypothetical protein